MWESRRDFQRVWEGWEAASWLSMLSTLCHFHGLLLAREAVFTATSTSAMGRAREEVFVVIVVDECFGDYASMQARSLRERRTSVLIFRKLAECLYSRSEAKGLRCLASLVIRK
jgi:hypothetical protein